MEKIRFGITASGYMARTHAEAIKRLGQTATLVAISGGTRAPGLAAQYGAARGREPSVEAMARRKDIDAIVVTTPQSLHFREVMLALEAGKHVLIEKPMATSVEDCDRMLEEAARRRLVIAVGYNLRFRNNPPRARELIAAGAIGRVVAVHHTMVFDAELFNTGNFGGNKSWIHLPENLGLVVDGLPHAIDTIRWLTGAEVKSVAGFARTFMPDRQNKDTAVGVFEFTNGAICSAFVCFGAARSLSPRIFALQHHRHERAARHGRIRRFAPVGPEGWMAPGDDPAPGRFQQRRHRLRRRAHESLLRPNSVFHRRHSRQADDGGQRRRWAGRLGRGSGLVESVAGEPPGGASLGLAAGAPTRMPINDRGRGGTGLGDGPALGRSTNRRGQRLPPYLESEGAVSCRAWLVVGLLWVVACSLYVTRNLFVTMHRVDRGGDFR